MSGTKRKFNGEMGRTGPPKKRFKRTFNKPGRQRFDSNPLPPTLPGNKYVRKFIRWEDLGNISGSAASDSFGHFSFRLQDIPNYSEFVALFDNFRIDKVMLLFMPNATDITTSSTALTAGRLITAIDYDDASNWSSINDGLQYESCLIKEFDQTFTRFLKPCYTVPVNNTAGTTGIKLSNDWVDCGTPDVIWYGVKYCIPQTTTNQVPSWRVFARFYLSFQQTR